ncbi:MAG: Sulfite exporter TauE/SafE [Firmicutes bacterium ADurb.Bin193]|nr:MAG: Sulfite exporter TauE/SafE [Firmicutes bacterium ADurb.Bin193]
MHFSVSGVDVFPLIPPLVALIVSSFTASAGISGAFLLLPFQVSVLRFDSPAVSPTNLIYNIIAIPGGLYRYIKEKRMAWALTWVVSVGTLPGVFVGAWIRIRYLPDPKAFKFFIGIVLLYLGYRIASDIFGWNRKTKDKNDILNKKFAKQVADMKKANTGRITAGLPVDAVVKTKSFSLSKVEYEFWGETYSFNTISVFILSLVVGLIGGIYGIGGGSIIAPFCVSVFALPVYTVAGAALAGTFITSIAGVIYYQILAFTAMPGSAVVSPDWLLGLLFGLGGIVGTYLGAYLQKFLPERLVKILLLSIVIFLSAMYIIQFIAK